MVDIITPMSEVSKMVNGIILMIVMLLRLARQRLLRNCRRCMVVVEIELQHICFNTEDTTPKIKNMMKMTKIHNGKISKLVMI